MMLDMHKKNTINLETEKQAEKIWQHMTHANIPNKGSA